MSHDVDILLALFYEANPKLPLKPKSGLGLYEDHYFILKNSASSSLHCYVRLSSF